MKLNEAAAIAQDVTAVQQFFVQRNLLRDDVPHCTQVECDRLMTEVKMRGTKDGVMWRCPLHKGHKLSIQDNSFLRTQTLPLETSFG